MTSDLELLNSSEENLKWFQENSDKIREKYQRKIVAIKDKKVVASAANSTQLLDLLKKNGIDDSEVLIEVVSSKDEIIIL